MSAGAGRHAALFYLGLTGVARLRLPGTTPRNKTMPIGTVKFFNADKGYGFIAPEDGGNDAFVHISAVEAAGMRTLDKEQRVSYELEQDRRGKMSAVNLSAA
jgi:CspA family cold shock protein